MTITIKYQTEDGTHLLDVVVDRLIYSDPDHHADNPTDYAGERELEWHLEYGQEFNDDGKLIQCGALPWWLNKLAEDYCAEIEARIWSLYRENMGSPVYEE